MTTTVDRATYSGPAPRRAEFNDPSNQRARFEARMKCKAAGNEEAMRVDEDFVRALEYGMPHATDVVLLPLLKSRD
jgi:hypothetical protein